MKKQNLGYTLIEVIVALAVFAIVAAIGGGVILQAFNTRTRLEQEFKYINTLQLTLTLLRREITQAINRPVRGTESRLFPPFTGEKNYIEFTRGGFVNPSNTVISSSLKRMALRCEQKKLIQRTWPVLDTPDRHHYQDTTLLDHLSEDCFFSFYTRSHEKLPSWRPYAVQQNQKKQPLPAAIELQLNMKHLGAFNELYIIPESNYGE